MRLVFGSIDAGAYVAFGTLILAIIGAIVGLVKVKPEAENIATKTTLEVIEAQRSQLKEARDEASALRKSLRIRDEELESLQRRFATLRLDFDALEAELHSLRGSNAPAA